ncbi:MAG: hypothetical protein IH962_02775 [Chloroflexi bacterium]|nr:hypothetical protein [Chloroflexota bacterium]
MSTVRITGLLFAIALFVAIPAVALAQSQPPRPAVFGGTATVNGVPAPDGTEVTAWIDGNQVGSAEVSNGAYAFSLVQPPGETFGGKEISFKIGDADAGQTAIWQTDGGGELDLSATGVQEPAPVTKPDPATTTVEASGAPQFDTGTDGGEKRRAFVGEVIGEPSATQVTLKRKGTEQEQSITLPDGLEPKTPGRPGVAGTFTDGARVVILVRKIGAEEWEAIRVLVKPTKLTAPPLTGSVVSIEDGILTIMRPNGTTKTVNIGRGGPKLEIGEVVTAFAGDANGEGGQDADGPPMAKGLVKASKVRERLEGFLDKLTAEDGKKTNKGTAKRAQRVADLASILETHANKHVNLLQKLTEGNLPPQALAGMQRALDNAQRGRSQAKLKAAEARTKSGLPADRGRGQTQAKDQGKPEAENKSNGQPGAQARGNAADLPSFMGRGKPDDGPSGQNENKPAEKSSKDRQDNSSQGNSGSGRY